MTLVVMALVNPSGAVVNKIVVDTAKPFTPPAGWSMREWTDADEAAYESYLASLKGGTA